MRKAAVLFFPVLIACSTFAPEDGQCVVVLSVERFHKPLVSLKAEVSVEGQDEPLTFRLKRALATAVISPSSTVRVTGWAFGTDASVEDPGEFTFSAPPGKIVLLPYKVVLVSKMRIEIKPMSPLDIEFARSQFTKKSPDALPHIIYPEIGE